MNATTRISFNRILCPIDRSEKSKEALRYGVALARAYNAKLLVCHCAELRALAEPAYHQTIEKYLKDSVAEHRRIPDACALQWEPLVFVGNPISAIPREAARQQADLIIIHSRRRPVAAGLLGSTAEAICRTAPCPVLVTHAREHEWAGATCNDLELKRVLVAFDDSPGSHLALRYGLSLVQEYQAELHLLQVLPIEAQLSAATVASFPITTESLTETVALKLQDVVPEEAYLWCQVKQAAREGHPYKEVLDYAAENDIDLICMGASGVGSRIQQIFGSTVDRVLRHAPCPVLIARQHQA